MSDKVFKDYLGQTIEVGDILSYHYLARHSMIRKLVRVVGFTEQMIRVEPRNSPGGERSLISRSNVLVITKLLPA